jgi:hypothetical protein
MKPPKGYPKDGILFRLRKTLYGLKQSGREWYLTLKGALLGIGWNQLLSDSCCFQRNIAGKQVIIVVYVDDILFFAENEETLRLAKTQLLTLFAGKDLGNAEYILGMHVERDQNGIYFNQKGLIERTFDRYNDGSMKQYKTPLQADIKLQANQDEIDKERQIKFQSLIGSLLYISRYTRPDITIAINMLATFTSNPSEEHLCYAQRVLQYLNATKELKLEFKGGNLKIEAFSDANWGNDRDTYNSTSGYVIRIGRCIVTWGSRKQRNIAQSTMESEYIAMSECAKEIIWIKQFLGEINVEVESTVLKSDNSSALSIAKNERLNPRAKHIGLRYHFIRQLIADDEFRVEYVGTNDNIADIFTKPLGKGKFNNMRQRLGLGSTPLGWVLETGTTSSDQAQGTRERFSKLREQ